MRLSPYFLALVLPLMAAARGPAPRLQYQDNPRPILLHLPSESMPVESVRVYFPTSLGVRFEIDATGRKNPTLWAKEEGRPIPGLKTFPGRIGRYGEARDKGLAFYWTGPEHAGVGYWQVWKNPDRPRLLAFAKNLDAAFSGTDPKRWFEYAAKLPAGSVIRLRFPRWQASVEIFGGDEEAGRAAADQALRTSLRAGEGWSPLVGMHSPSFVAKAARPIGALMIAGRMLVSAGPHSAEASLRRLAAFVKRPLPPPPEIGESPMGGATLVPPPTSLQERLRRKRQGSP